MTLEQFLVAYQDAARDTDARAMTGEAYAPKGRYVRFLLPPSAATRHPAIPPVVDPIGLVYAAQYRFLVSPLESQEYGRRLGLSEATIAEICHSADFDYDAVGSLWMRKVRDQLVAVVENLPPKPHLPYL